MSTGFNTVEIILWIWIVYLALGLLMYWLPLLAVLFLSSRPRPALLDAPARNIHFYIVSACRDSAGSIPGLVQCLRGQNYPMDNFRILILADNCSDNSAAVARGLNVDVYERHNPGKMGKGYALNELLESKLKSDTFDVLVLFDVDARVDEEFLNRAAHYFRAGAMALQGATVSKNPDQTLLTRVGDIIQGVIRLFQTGRSRLGWRPLMVGSHGIALSRESLENLGWRISTGRTGDDIELGIRCFLNNVSVWYAPDLRVSNDLPSQADAVRRQRRRWSASPLRLLPKYFMPLLLKAVPGDWPGLVLLSGLILPYFSTLFILLTITLAGLGLTSLWHGAAVKMFFWVVATLWVADVSYFLCVFRLERIRMNWRDIWGFTLYLFIRSVTLIESFVFIFSKDWWHTWHGNPEHETRGAIRPKD